MIQKHSRWPPAIAIDNEELKRPQTKLQSYWRPLVLSNGKTYQSEKQNNLYQVTICKIPKGLNY